MKLKFSPLDLITGEELIAKWKISINKLEKIIYSGLLPSYTENRTTYGMAWGRYEVKMPVINVHEENLFEPIPSRTDIWYEKFNAQLMPDNIEKIKTFCFHKNDIEDFEKKHPDLLDDKLLISQRKENEQISMDNVKQILKNICQDIEIFYNGLVQEVKVVKNYESIDNINQNDLYKIAIDYFSRSSNDYQELTADIITDKDIYRNIRRRKRGIVGSILQRHLKTFPPNTFKSISTTIDSLHSLHGEIINSKI